MFKRSNKYVKLVQNEKCRNQNNTPFGVFKSVTQDKFQLFSYESEHFLKNFLIKVRDTFMVLSNSYDEVFFVIIVYPSSANPTKWSCSRQIV